jgi:NADH:ubiquinone oxidoreductase subunit 5 (subunit L)/multisubunit Na+/H+ antiporter MnhA subunit
MKVYLYCILAAFVLAGVPLYNVYCTSHGVVPYLVPSWFSLFGILHGIVAIGCLFLTVFFCVVRFDGEKSAKEARSDLLLLKPLWGVVFLPLWVMAFFAVQWGEPILGIGITTITLAITTFNSCINKCHRETLEDEAKKGTVGK